MTTPLISRERILIIDDEAEIRNLLSELLGESYDCETAASAEEALALLPGERFQLVLSDVTMTGMTGVQMIPLLRQIAPETVIMLVSGTQNIEGSIEAMRAGAFDYILKPFDLDQVEVAVKRALEHFRLREEKRLYEARLEQLVNERTAQLNCALERVEEAYRTTIKALTSSLETRDTETHGHSERVVKFSLHLGRAMNLDAEQLRSLEFGAMLHDIGKIGVPDSILRKPGKLDEAEWVKMRLHPTLGSQILNGIEFLQGAARVVEQHHERWDGAGYPKKLSGEAIDLNARIFAVADAFDALQSDRVYRSGRIYAEAREELNRNAGTQFDPRVIEAFNQVPAAEWEMLQTRETDTVRQQQHFLTTGVRDEADRYPLTYLSAVAQRSGEAAFS